VQIDIPIFPQSTSHHFFQTSPNTTEPCLIATLTDVEKIFTVASSTRCEAQDLLWYSLEVSTHSVSHRYTEANISQLCTRDLVVSVIMIPLSSRTSQALMQTDVVPTDKKATPTTLVRLRPPDGAQHLASKLKATLLAHQISLILTNPNVVTTPMADVLSMQQRGRGRHPVAPETLLISNKATTNFLNRRISSRLPEISSRLASSPSTQPDSRHLYHRLLNRRTDLAAKTNIMTSVESITVALHIQRSSKDADGRSATIMLTLVHYAIAMTMLTLGIIAVCFKGSDSRTVKSLRCRRDSANVSRGKSRIVSHHNSHNNILPTASDTLNGHVDVTMAPKKTSPSIVPVVTMTLIVEEIFHTSRLCKHLELLSRAEYISACHGQSTTLFLLDTPYIMMFICTSSPSYSNRRLHQLKTSLATER